MTSSPEIPFYRYKRFMTDRYGAPLFRVPIDLGLGCPNRDAAGRGGCTFCPEDGGRAEQTLHAETVEEQVRDGMAFARSRYGATRFQAYMQAFTSTFAPASEQRDLYRGLLARYPFESVSIGTRPDCLPPATLDFLTTLASDVNVWVELGVQTTHDHTLQRINRGHDWACSREAILALDARGIAVAVHLMAGLPGEDAGDCLLTAERVAALPVSAVKIHNLHVVRGTPLAETYRKQPFITLQEDEYADILIEMLRRLPAHVGIMRINTDTPRDELIAPVWQLKKGQFLEYVIRTMRQRGVVQGDLFVA